MARVISVVQRADPDTRDAFAAPGVATAHEAQGRTGLLSHRVSAHQSGASISGTAVTCWVPPGDDWMIHVATEQAQGGDVRVAAPTPPCDDGCFGDLLATAAMARGLRGLVIDAGVRDVAHLSTTGFPVWSRGVSAQGAVKETSADVQAPIVCAGALVHPGDVVAADDGLCTVPRLPAPGVLATARERAAAAEEKRVLHAQGQLGLDVGDMRSRLAERGLELL